MKGTAPPSSSQLVTASDRLSFIYLEHCVVHRDQNAVTATNDEGTLHIPAAVIGCLLLGPGTRVTHAAMTLLGNCGVTVCWVGEGVMRCYASGRPLARSSRLLEAQARAFATQHARLAIARRMYEMRFPGENVSSLTMQQLRGREGARIRALYREHSERTGVEWGKRQYNPGDFENSDPINQTLTSANTCLYGIVAGVVNALGMSPGLGFVHVGHDQSFIYDIADLFKAETSIPAAFETVASGSTDPANDVRRTLRDTLLRQGFMTDCVNILKELFLERNEVMQLAEIEYNDELSLWSGRAESRLPSAMNHGPAAR